MEHKVNAPQWWPEPTQWSARESQAVAGFFVSIAQHPRHFSIDGLKLCQIEVAQHHQRAFHLFDGLHQFAHLQVAPPIDETTGVPESQPHKARGHQLGRVGVNIDYPNLRAIQIQIDVLHRDRGSLVSDQQDLVADDGIPAEHRLAAVDRLIRIAICKVALNPTRDSIGDLLQGNHIGSLFLDSVHDAVILIVPAPNVVRHDRKTGRHIVRGRSWHIARSIEQPKHDERNRGCGQEIR